MKLAEPVTAITDYILAGQTFYLGSLLLAAGSIQDQDSIRLWGVAFFVSGVAALVGGTYHGFIHFFGRRTSSAIWTTTVFSIALSTFFMFCATVFSTLPRAWGPGILAAAVGQFLFVVVWVSRHSSFRFVVYNYGPLMVVVLILHGIAVYLRAAAGSGWIAVGILVSFAGAAVQLTGFRSHKHFNHNDVYHMVQMAAMYLLYRGALLMHDM